MSTSHGQLGNPIDFSTQVVVHREIHDFETEQIPFPKLPWQQMAKRQKPYLATKSSLLLLSPLCMNHCLDSSPSYGLVQKAHLSARCNRKIPRAYERAEESVRSLNGLGMTRLTFAKAFS